mgnify:CR=1 FL=1
MATTDSFFTYAMDCLQRAGAVTARRMMGEYCLYYRGKLIGDICDNVILLKDTPGAAALLPAARRAYPYEGSRHLMLVLDAPEDTATVAAVLEALYADLPVPKPRKERKPQK